MVASLFYIYTNMNFHMRYHLLILFGYLKSPGQYLLVMKKCATIILKPNTDSLIMMLTLDFMHIMNVSVQA